VKIYDCISFFKITNYFKGKQWQPIGSSRKEKEWDESFNRKICNKIGF
jgi:hypothetical protein